MPKRSWAGGHGTTDTRRNLVFSKMNESYRAGREKLKKTSVGPNEGP